MALPKEPRQKMINIMYLVLTAILALNVSAEILNAFKVVDRSLGKSNESIDKSNSTLFASLKSKWKTLLTGRKPLYGMAKPNRRKRWQKGFMLKLKRIKTILKSFWLNPEKGIDNYKEDDLDAATRLFTVCRKKLPELYNDLKTLREGLLNIDPEISKEFASKLPIDLEIPKSTTGSENSWEYNYFPHDTN